MNESGRFSGEGKRTMEGQNGMCGMECTTLSGGANSSSEDGESHGDGAGEGWTEITVSTAGESSELSSMSNPNRLSRGQSRRNLCDLGEETTRNRPFQPKSLDSVVERQSGPSSASTFTDGNQGDKNSSFRMKLEWEPPAAMVSGANTPSGGEESSSESPLCDWSHDILYKRSMEIASRGRLIMVRVSVSLSLLLANITVCRSTSPGET